MIVNVSRGENVEVMGKLYNVKTSPYSAHSPRE